MKPNGLAYPNSFAAVAGSAKMPAPMMPLIASAVRSHRVMARIKEAVAAAGLFAVPGIGAHDTTSFHLRACRAHARIGWFAFR